MQSNRFRYFVLLAGMRTGSNLFENNINSFQNFSCHGELFNPNFVGFLKKQPIVDISLEEREKEPIRTIEALLETVTGTLPGFRLFDDHDPRILDYVLADHSCAKIILSRNPLDSFVSLQIATRTDQWKMSDAHKRKKANVEFSIKEFETYLSEKKDFGNHIRMHLQLSGQAAFHLNYDDLMDVDVFNGLSKYLGSEEVLVEFDTKMMRQNPEPLSQKVENYDQMMQELKNVNLLEPPILPHLEPSQERNTQPFIAATRNPMICYAMGSENRQAIVAWMQSHEPRADNIQTDMNDRQLDRWFSNRTGAHLFVLLNDPVQRVHEAFENSVLSVTDKSFRRLRNNLNRNYGFALPELKGASLTKEALDAVGYSLDDYKADFERFLDFLDANLKGQTRAPVSVDFASQSALVQSLSDWHAPSLIIRPDQIENGLTFLENQLGLSKNPFAPSRHDSCVSEADFITDDHRAQIHTLYKRDYDQFGF